MRRNWSEAGEYRRRPLPAGADSRGRRDAGTPRRSGGNLFDIRNTWCAFDGRSPHAAMNFRGTRFSLVYFTSRNYDRLPYGCRNTLLVYGFRLPDDGADSGDSGRTNSHESADHDDEQQEERNDEWN